MKKSLVLLLVSLLTLSLFAGCSSTEGEAEQGQEEGGPVVVESLRISFSPYADADEIMTATEPLEQLLQARLLEKGFDVKEISMTVGTNYTAVGEALSAGSADLGFISGGNYVLFSEDCDVLLTALRNAINKDSLNPADWNDGTIEENTADTSTYYRCIVLAGPSEKGRALQAKVAAGEALTWEDLDGAAWSVLSPTSASGYIYPALWLQENYGKGISDLTDVIQSDSHTTSVARLASQQVDVMVSYGHIRIKNSLIWESELGGTAPMVEQTGIIGVTDGIYNDMIAYSKNSETMADPAFRQAVGEAFIELAETEEGQAVFSVFSQIGYTFGKDSDYDGERAAQQLLRSLEG
ncbi:MAG: PhnD/SsuA/transferrin family substrate-binding protein [Clostridia bacterium]|nr:PhnD/SsuA/transferrin family substrate-binding protein [Clostridia bacterium]MBQ3076767.1 PhnD/SsuA/transferrin family substrate-binding protein [Clostridia bacterium]